MRKASSLPTLLLSHSISPACSVYLPPAQSTSSLPAPTPRLSFPVEVRHYWWGWRWGELRDPLAFIHASRDKGTSIPLSTEVRSPTLGKTHPAFHSVTLFAPFHWRTNLIGQSPEHSEGWVFIRTVHEVCYGPEQVLLSPGLFSNLAGGLQWEGVRNLHCTPIFYFPEWQGPPGSHLYMTSYFNTLWGGKISES